MSYTQLCTFSAYSFSESLILPFFYAKRAKELGYQSIGVIDSNLYVYPSFADACSKEGLTPIFGYSFLLRISNSMPLKACFFIKNEQGYLNLCKFVSHKKKEYDIADILQKKEGLKLVIQAKDESFFDEYYLTLISPEITKLQKAYQDDFSLGLTLITKEDAKEACVLYDYCKNHDLQLLCFPEVRYLHKNDQEMLDILKAGSKKEIVSNLQKEGPYFLLSPKALTKIYRREEIENSEKFVSDISFSFFQKRGSLIRFTNDKEQLRAKTRAGLEKRLATKTFPPEYEERLNYELSVIEEMNFSSYFLIVEDYVNFAKNSGIKVGPGRGSAGGSLVSYALGITDINPLLYHLSFERFLNPKRKTMPDIDVDFDDKRRNEIVDYLRQKYTDSHVATIRTFVTLRPKSALQLVASALQIPDAHVKNITSNISDKARDFQEALHDEYKGYRLSKVLKDPYYFNMVEKAEKLLGIPVSLSIHAPGVILAQNEISTSCPREQGKTGTVEFEYQYMERMGFLKFDILPLSNLSFIKEIEDEISKDKKEIVNTQEHLDDPKVFAVLNRLATCDIFQLDATYGVKKAIEQIHPESFRDIAAILALYRPGPMEYISTYAKRKNKQEKVVYLHPLLEPILQETYGIMIYQEQVMKVVQVLALFSASDADLFRRAISKKDLSKMKEYQEKFETGCRNNGVPSSVSAKVYEDIERFAGYGFNKSHAYAYALITYQLLYYKAHFPEEFYRVAFRNVSFASEHSTRLLRELNDLGIHAHLPSINHSLEKDIYVEKDALYPPLEMINGVDKKLISCILEERSKGEYQNFYDFCHRIVSNVREQEERSLLSLIDAGCMDEFCKSRLGMEEILKTYLEFARMDFDPDKIPPVPNKEEDYARRLVNEKAKNGLILSKKVSSLGVQKGYRTLIVSDASRYEMENIIVAEDESRTYQIHCPKTQFEIQKYDIVFVKAEFNRKGRIYADDILLGRKKVLKHV